MRRTVAAAFVVTASLAALAQQPPARPMSPEGSAQTQVLGKWSKGERPSFAVGRENYTGGRWIEITYGRPLQRGRDVFGSGANYGKALNDVGLPPNLPPPPVWRAGANVSTRLETEVPLVFGDKKVPAGEYSLFIDVNSPSQWTLIVSNWGAMTKFDPNNKTALWGAYNYTADKDVAWLTALAAREFPGVRIAPRADLAIVAVQGPNARAKVWRSVPESETATAALKPFHAVRVATRSGDLFIARTGYTGEDGFEIVLPGSQAEALWRALAAQGVVPCGLAARDTLRLEAGMNLYGQDMDETVTPLESALSWTVDLASGRDFVGRQALVEQRAQRSLAGLLLLDAGGVLRAHQKVHTAHGDGEITSGTFSPTMKRSVALARLPVGVAVGDTVHAEVRDRKLAARVVKPPFVRNGKVLVG